MNAFLLAVTQKYPILFQFASWLILFVIFIVFLVALYLVYWAGFQPFQQGEAERSFFGLIKRNFHKPNEQQVPPLNNEQETTQFEKEPPPETSQNPDEEILKALGLPSGEDTKDEPAKDHFKEGRKIINEGDFSRGYKILKDVDLGEKETQEDRNILLAREAFHEYMDNGTREGLDELKNLFLEGNDSLEVQRWYSLALALCKNRDLDLASALVDESIIRLGASEERAMFITAKAHILSKKNTSKKGIDLLKTEIPNFQKPEYLSKLYQELGDFYFKLKGEDSCEGIFCWQTAIAYNPPSSGFIFDFAYRLSDKGKDAEALYYYQMLNEGDINYEIALNNMGVSAKELGLKIASVDNYQKSKEQGETLAVANLANLLMAKGFHNQAEKMLKEANKVEGYHKNVDLALVALQKEKEDELEKKNNILKNASLLISQNIEYAKALIKKDFDFNSLVGDYLGEPKGLKIFKDDSGNLKGKVIEKEKAETRAASLLNMMGEKIVKNASLNFTGEGNLLWFTWEGPEPTPQDGLLIPTKDQGSGCLLIKDSGNALEGYLTNGLKPAKKLVEWKLTKS